MPKGQTTLRSRAKKWFSDGDSNKTSPNSLYSVLRGIRRRWNAKGDEVLQPDEFAAHFQGSYDAVQDKYRGNKPSRSLVRKINNIETKAQGIDYFMMRCYAHHVNIPTSLLVFYSHMIGEISHGSSKEEIVAIVDSYMRSIGAFRDEIVRISNISTHLIENRDAGAYDVLMDGLRTLSIAFNQSPPKELAG